MSTDTFVEFVEQQDWMDPLANEIHTFVSDTFTKSGERGRKLKDFLNGTWLGHPVHPILTDVAIGSWVAAEAFVGPGVTMGEGAVLGARAVAFSDLAPWTVYVGNPAKPIKTRGARQPVPLTIRRN